MNDEFNAIITPIDPPLRMIDHGPLSGLDFVVKDLFDVAGRPTNAGNPDYAGYHGIPERNAVAVNMALAAGARLVGKTHLHELAYGITGINPHYGIPVNPLDAKRIPGGSSSGSAVAVASGLTPFSLGTDTAGSIRVPAGFCGIFSLRPTYGKIPVDGSVPLSPSQDTVGIFARDLDMLARVASVLVTTVQPNDIPIIRPQRIIILDDMSDWDPGMAKSFAALTDSLKRKGFKIQRLSFDLLRDSLEAQKVVQYSEVLGVHEKWLREKNPALGEDVALHIRTASKMSVAEIGRAVSKKAVMASEFVRILGRDGIFVLPVAAGPAPLILDISDMERSMKFRVQTLAFNTIASITGLPAVTIPIKNADGLSCGIQFIGQPDSDIELITMVSELSS